MAFLGVFLNVLGPVAVVIAGGYLMGPRLGIEARPLSRLAFWVLGPAFMFDILWDSNLSGGVAVRLAIAGVAGLVVAAAVGAAVVRTLGGSRQEWSAAAMTSGYGNVGNTGLAISVFALGPEILPAAGVFMLAVNVPGMVLGIGLAQAERGSLWQALRIALLAPMPVASFFAFAVNVTGSTPPLIATRAISLVAGALIPVMLFTLGAQLAETGRVSLVPAVTVPTVAKLVVAPAVAAMTGIVVGLEDELLALTVIQSAMPPAVFCMVIALEQELAPKLVTSTVVFATLAAALTVPVAIAVAP